MTLLPFSRWCAVFAATILTVSFNFAAETIAARPNVILILADDLGSIDLNCYGAADLLTPALDRLAARGVRFSQFYAAAPVCSPSRAAFITGLYPQRAGVPGNVSSESGVPGMPATTRTGGNLF